MRKTSNLMTTTATTATTTAMATKKSSGFRIGKFFAAYRTAVVWREIAIHYVVETGRTAPRASQKNDDKRSDRIYKDLVDKIMHILLPLRMDDHEYRIRILKNKLKSTRFEAVKAALIEMEDLIPHPYYYQAHRRLIADIDKVIKRAKRVHLTYRAMRVYEASTR